MIGRKAEIAVIDECLFSNRPEFLAVYGRRRIGKTFLIKEYFNDTFSFYATGVAKLSTRKQLKIFNESLIRYGSSEKTIPTDWFEAFRRLRDLLSSDGVYREYKSGKRVIFLDELPWMDTAKSDFKPALDYFWNSWASAQKDLLLIICGSATSWIIKNIVKDTGGFYNRLTRQIHLMPFCLAECEQLLISNGVNMTRRQIIECYMIYGGIPYYLNYIRPGLSLAQNTDLLFFKDNSPLRYEFINLFSSLFNSPQHYTEIIRALSLKNSGLTRKELLASKSIPNGKTLTKCLQDLEQCGFIRKYHDFTRNSNGAFYQLTDPLTLFYLTFIESGTVSSWMDYIDSPAYFSWCDIAFERVVLLHTDQIKHSMSILGVSSQEFSWKSRNSSPGAQIDLLIDRKDDVINVCEIKYSKERFAIDSSYEKNLIRKLEVFRNETNTKKALFLTMISVNGLADNKYRGIVLNEITGDDLFTVI